MINKSKVKKAIRLEEAIKQNREAYVLLQEIEELSTKIDAIPQVDLTEMHDKLNNLKDEEIVVELNIV